MGISCECNADYEAEWWWEVHHAPTILDTKRSRKCISCGEKLQPDSAVYKVFRWRNPKTEIEERIFGEGGEVYMADWHLCLSCAAIYHALQRVKVCVNLGEDNLHDYLAEFNTCYAPRGFHLKVCWPELVSQV